MRTSFNHQPEAQHPKHPAIRWAADYPIFGSNSASPIINWRGSYTSHNGHKL
jgi:hypothetical protein